MEIAITDVGDNVLTVTVPFAVRVGEEIDPSVLSPRPGEVTGRGKPDADGMPVARA